VTSGGYKTESVTQVGECVRLDPARADRARAADALSLSSLDGGGRQEFGTSTTFLVF
jgi:hypothetical protein